MKVIGRPCAVVTIKSAMTGGPVRINKSDYDADPKKWELFEESEQVEDSDEKVPEDKSTTAKLARRVRKRVKPDSN